MINPSSVKLILITIELKNCMRNNFAKICVYKIEIKKILTFSRMLDPFLHVIITLNFYKDFPTSWKHKFR
jgi:hypothetical protein